MLYIKHITHVVYYTYYTHVVYYTYYPHDIYYTNYTHVVYYTYFRHVVYYRYYPHVVYYYTIYFLKCGWEGDEGFVCIITLILSIIINVNIISQQQHYDSWGAFNLQKLFSFVDICLNDPVIIVRTSITLSFII